MKCERKMTYDEWKKAQPWYTPKIKERHLREAFEAGQESGCAWQFLDDGVIPLNTKGDVIVCDKYEQVFCAHYNKTSGWWSADGHTRIKNIIAWKPLPLPPKQKEIRR